MVSIKLECVSCPRVSSFFVSKEISVWSQLSKDWPIREDFFLDTVDFSRKTEVDYFVEVIGLSAHVLLEVIIRAFFFLSNEWEASFR